MMETCPDCRAWKQAAEMVAYDTIAFFHYDDETQQIMLCLNVNDTFVRAADAEPVPWMHIPDVHALWKAGGWQAVVTWVARRRGQSPLSGTP